MKNLFEHTSSTLVRYSDYEYRSADGIMYITPTADSTPILYDPLESYAVLEVDALNLGRTAARERNQSQLQAVVLSFVRKYGLLGFLTALPTTPAFMDYKKVYLPKNHFIRAESMQTEDYLHLFFPFESLDVVK